MKLTTGSFAVAASAAVIVTVGNAFTPLFHQSTIANHSPSRSSTTLNLFETLFGNATSNSKATRRRCKAQDLIKSLVEEQNCFSTEEGANAFVEACASNVVYEDCFAPEPFVGKTVNLFKSKTSLFGVSVCFFCYFWYIQRRDIGFKLTRPLFLRSMYKRMLPIICSTKLRNEKAKVRYGLIE